MVRASFRVYDETIFDVAYTIDEEYRRVTPASDGHNAAQTVLFFGGSFVFGQGVNDEDTLPNRVAQRLPGARVMNYGFPGHGTQHMLERIRQWGEGTYPYEGPVTAIYVFIPHHVRRTIGSMRVSGAWGRQFPCYAVGGSGGLTRLGTFASARPWQTRLYAWLHREPILAYYGIDLPVRIRDEHLELTSAIIRESKKRLSDYAGPVRFVVVLYPDHPRFEFSSDRIAPFLPDAGVEIRDFRSALDLNEPDALIPHDLHPSAATHSTVAELVVERLNAETGN